MSDHDIESWPEVLRNAVDDKTRFSIVVEPERKLCDQCDFLYFSEGKLQFHSQDLGEMCFDFEETWSYHQRQRYALSKEPLAKSLGIKGEQHPLVWDTTCGTGKDSLLIKTFGANLLSFERHPAVFLLLEDAKRRFPLDFSLVFADASQLSFSDIERPDVIYYDPMYPEKTGSKKSALPRKEMRIFKDVVGEDHDSEAFLEWALRTARSRVVVKRSLSALPVRKNPTASYMGKSTRYDMYKIQG